MASASGLPIRRVAFDPKGLPSRVDLDAVCDAIHAFMVATGQDLEALGAASVGTNDRVTRELAGLGGAAAPTAPVSPRTLTVLACVANQDTYDLGFTPNPAWAVMVWKVGLALTPVVDFTVSGSSIILAAGQVPVESEGYIVVEATRP